MAKTYNTISTVATGDVYTATAHNNIVTNVNNYRVPPMCTVVRTSNQTGYTSQAAISWSSAILDTESPSDPMWAAGSPTVVTVRTAGMYLVTYNARVTATATTTFTGLMLLKNGASIGQLYVPAFSPSVAPEMRGTMSLLVSASVGDTFGAAATIIGGSAYVISGTATTDNESQTRLTVAWIGQVS